MKRLILSFAFFGAAASFLHAQPSNGSYAVMAREAHSRVWGKVALKTNEAGDVVAVTNKAYVELGTGICRQDSNGQWVDASEEIDLVADGAQAGQGRHFVHWMANANTPGGAVRLLTPDNKELLSRVYGLAYWDTSTGSNVALATLHDCQGVVGKNQVLYENAFDGLDADIQYSYRLSGLEQNVLLRARPPSPASVGLMPASTHLMVISEFFNPPSPRVMTVQRQGMAEDALLDFGDMKIGPGKAFLTPEQGRAGPAKGVKVTKHWRVLENRYFLFEEVEYPAISNLLETLPQASASKVSGAIQRTASLLPLRPNTVPARPGGPMRLAQSPPGERGLVIDYSIVSGSSDPFVFQGDTTYFVSDPANFFSTNTFEGGTVVKFINDRVSLCTTYLDYFVFNASSYRPAVFTSADDNSVGDTISGSSGHPVQGPTTTYLEPWYATDGGFGVVEHARFSYAGVVLYADDLSTEIFRHCQFVQCGTIAEIDAPYDPVPGNLYLQNVLATGCGSVLQGMYDIYWQGWLALHGENITVDGCNLNLNPAMGDRAFLTNSILTGTDAASCGTNVTLCSCAVASNGAGLYQTAGAGSYYLAAGSTNQNAGTTNIDPTLLADLQSMTTYPPVIVQGLITGSNALFPQVQRDPCNPPDRGYHYDPLDYALNIYLENAIVSAAPGTAMALYGNEYGVWLNTHAVFNSVGTATSPNYLVRYNTVQEQPNSAWASANWEASILCPNQVDPSSASFIFTDLAVLSSDYQFSTGNNQSCPITFQNCQIFGGQIEDHGPTIISSNCLYKRVNLQVKGSTSNVFCNNLFLQGSLTSTHKAPPWTFRDNLFDQTCITNLFTTRIAVCSNNAYVTTNFGILQAENSNVILSNSPAYQAGPLGQYYYPPDLPLIHTGSQSAAAAGLAFFTVLTNSAIWHQYREYRVSLSGRWVRRHGIAGERRWAARCLAA